MKGVSFKMVRIPAGEFMMGSPASEPGRDNDATQHRVRIGRDFWRGETEVTQELRKAVMGGNPSYLENCGYECPVERVLWEDCKEFMRKLNGMVSGGGFLLPTEAEWEYACRAGTTGAYAWDLDAMRWYGNNSGRRTIDASAIWNELKDDKKYIEKSLDNGSRTHAVAGKKPNAWGLYDMHGNVWEWCEDWKGEYPSDSVTDPIGSSSSSGGVLRGGSLFGVASNCRSADRNGRALGDRSPGIGLRLALP